MNRTRTSSRMAASAAAAPDDSDIERTADYEQFVEKLQAYHDERGTTLTVEPEIGRQKLDIFKLYKKVTSEGGYDKVTAEKGGWRGIANSYKLAGQTTNAGFLLKNIYFKNLAAFEISDFFKKDPPPKEQLEDRSSARGPILSKSNDDSDDSSSSSSEKEKTPTPPLSTGRTLRQAPPKRDFYQPGVQTSRPSSIRSGSQHSNSMNPQNFSGSPPRGAAGGPAPFLQMNGNGVPFARTVPTPYNDPQRFAQNRPRVEPPRQNNIRGGGPLESARVYFSLKSGLPSDVSYALQYLVVITSETPLLLLDPNFPEFLELVVQHLSTAKLVHEYSKIINQSDNLLTKQLSEDISRLVNAALIIRNFSQVEDRHLQYLINIKDFKPFIKEIMGLPLKPYFSDLRSITLEIIESTAGLWVFEQGDTTLKELKAGVNSSDRTIVLRTLRILALAGSAYGISYLTPEDCNAIEKVQPLLYLDDPDLLFAIVYLISTFTANEANCRAFVNSITTVPIVKQLVRLLEYGAMTTDSKAEVLEHRKPVPPIPYLPTELIQELMTYPEPERAANWIRCCFEEDPLTDITQIQLWQGYQGVFAEFVPRGRPLLPAADFIKHVSIAYPSAGAKVIEVAPGQTKFIIRGIRPRTVPVSPKGGVYFPCKWYLYRPGGHVRCSAMTLSAADMFAHIRSEHLPHQPVPSEGQSATPVRMYCNWAGCMRFGNDGTTDRLAVLAHIRTHIPDMVKERSQASRPVQRISFETQTPMVDNVTGGVAALPLTVVLALKNLCKLPEGRELLYPLRDEIALIGAATLGTPLGLKLGEFLIMVFTDSAMDLPEKEEDGASVE